MDHAPGPAGSDPENGGAMNVLATLQTITTADDDDYSAVASLVVRAQAGDREAFGCLIEQFQRTVHAICLRRLGNPSEALEMTQEVFLHVMNRISQLREPERFAGWLRQVTVRMAINRATRRNEPITVETVVLEGTSGEQYAPVDELISRERASRLWEGLDRLKSLDRETLVAFYIQGQSLLEMADRLDAPLGTIKRRLHTARKRLRVELEALAEDADEWSDGADSDLDDESDEGDLVASGSGMGQVW